MYLKLDYLLPYTLIVPKASCSQCYTELRVSTDYSQWWLYQHFKGWFHLTYLIQLFMEQSIARLFSADCVVKSGHQSICLPKFESVITSFSDESLSMR